jgi:hypothetical protein
MNRGKKSKVGKKSEGGRSTEENVLSADSSRKDADQNSQESSEVAAFEPMSVTKTPPQGTEKGTSFISDDNTARDTKPETFSSEMVL